MCLLLEAATDKMKSSDTHALISQTLSNVPSTNLFS